LNLLSMLLVACLAPPPARLAVSGPTDAGPAVGSRSAEAWWEPTLSDWSDWTISGCADGAALPARARTGGTFAVVEVTTEALRWRGDVLLPLDGGRLPEAALRGLRIPALYEEVLESVWTRRTLLEHQPCLALAPDAVLYTRSPGVPVATERAVLFTLGQATAAVDWLAAAPAGASSSRSWTLDDAVPLAASPYPSIAIEDSSSSEPVDHEGLLRLLGAIPDAEPARGTPAGSGPTPAADEPPLAAPEAAGRP